MRVMSRKPPAARRSSVACSSPPVAATSMSVVAASWGTWLTTATRASWCSGVTATTSAPSSETRVWIVENAAASVLCVGVSTHVDPTKRSALAPSSPSCSDPAIGCPPTKRAARSGRRRATSATTGAFTEPTSPTAGTPASRISATMAGTAATGTATKVASTPLDRRRDRARGLVERAHLLCPGHTFGIEVEAADFVAGAPQREPDRTSDEPGPDDRHPTHRLLREVVSERSCSFEVHVVQVVTSPVGVAVDQDADAPGHPAVDRELPGAEEGDVAEADALAAVAGNSDVRSSVAVKITLTRSSWSTALRARISFTSAWVFASISAWVFSSHVVAPRSARTFTRSEVSRGSRRITSRSDRLPGSTGVGEKGERSCPRT